ncbi:uncharacterized protein LOC133652293 [Entelurus aequoreus]|uniref:uncharacterized protein LOC133652293 n=1 Tax=Entelurus aequoreus TaxID=161455 RepID=UPI002B1E0318|nr:uncharacterized protein LOC133652293 [Entelurus aequoreus]XP_061906862.1 uncharacterized protein LOC133652293 [Entelurus aequoreus]
MKIRQTNNGEYPSFRTFVEFVTMEADLACDPIASMQALKGLDTSKPKHSRSQVIQAKTLTTNSSHSTSSGHTNTVTCLLCKRNGHTLDKCFKFMEKMVQDRIKFAQTEKLCFGCLKTGHHSKKCDKRSTCEKCQRRHLTCLHDDKFMERKQATPANSEDNSQDKVDTKVTKDEDKSTAISNRVTQDISSTLTSSILPVWVSSTNHPEKEVLVYALLDSQSDTSFILDEVAQDLNTDKSKASLRLSTMSAKSTVIPCEKLVNLQVRGYKWKKKIILPPVFTREFIPVNRSHIPTSETTLKWSHMEKLADKLPPMLKCEVGLLIGYNCQQALLPREVLAGKENQPYAQLTDLGWSIVGCSSQVHNHNDAIGTSHRIIVREVTPASQPAVELKHLASQGKDKFSKETVKFIQRGFYVDDGLASVTSTTEAIKLVEESRALCKTGKLHLRKFVSNNKEMLKAIPQEEQAQAKDQDLALGEPHVERALGVQWCIEADEFQFRVQVKDNPLTRRGVLSTVASVYDPLGFVAPFILIGKQILQTLCKDKVNWDDNLPDHILPRWEAWLRDLPNLAALKIPRSYSEDINVVQYELHNFSDASLEGYGACSYLRTISKEGRISCSLVMGKARVTPTKQTTIPRLELSSAVTSVRNADVIKRELEIENLKEYYWSDSQVVLAYISNDAKRFHTFVANRIQRIRQSTSPEKWQHVSSENNPADHASRGLSATQLKESNWLKGPDFLRKQDLPVNEEMVGEIEETDPELRKGHTHTTQRKQTQC